MGHSRTMSAHDADQSSHDVITAPDTILLIDVTASGSAFPALTLNPSARAVMKRIDKTK